MLVFISNNKTVLIGILLGIVAGFIYWYCIGCYMGLYPLSAEWWVDMSIGGLLGGFIATLTDKKYQIEFQDQQS